MVAHQGRVVQKEGLGEREATKASRVVEAVGEGVDLAVTAVQPEDEAAIAVAMEDLVAALVGRAATWVAEVAHVVAIVVEVACWVAMVAVLVGRVTRVARVVKVERVHRLSLQMPGVQSPRLYQQSHPNLSSPPVKMPRSPCTLKACSQN